jgi:hypothetical protein
VEEGNVEDIPKTFDWVKARSECSLRHVFLMLAEVIDSDVKAAQSHIPGAKFKINKTSDDKFIVVKSWDASGVDQAESVAFEATKQGIAVKDVRTGKRLFLAKPELTANGDCKLRSDDNPDALEMWQVSRKALEDLFFGS